MMGRIFLLTFLLVLPGMAQADDVYNFYFSKKETKGKPKLQVSEVLAEYIPESEPGEKSWSIKSGFGYVSGSDGYMFGGQYNFNRYFDVEGEVQLTSQPGSSNQMAIGLAVTPIHLNIFGHETIALAGTTGFMLGNGPTTPYLGGRLRVNISESFGIEYATKKGTSDHNDTTMSSLSATYSW